MEWSPPAPEPEPERAVAAFAPIAANVRCFAGAAGAAADVASEDGRAAVTGVAADDADILRTGLLYYSKKLGLERLL